MTAANRDGAIAFAFGDGDHVFRLAMGQLEELQEKTGVGPFLLLNRMIAGEWRVQDVYETLRLGLVGGGMAPLDALGLARRYVRDRADWLGNAASARLVLMAALAGAAEEEPGKDGAPEAATEASTFQTDASPSAPSTAAPPPLA